MTNRIKAEAVWCGCGREALIHLSEDILCPFCVLALMVEAEVLEKRQELRAGSS